MGHSSMTDCKHALKNAQTQIALQDATIRMLTDELATALGELGRLEPVVKAARQILKIQVSQGILRSPLHDALAALDQVPP